MVLIEIQSSSFAGVRSKIALLIKLKYGSKSIANGMRVSVLGKGHSSGFA